MFTTHGAGPAIPYVLCANAEVEAQYIVFEIERLYRLSLGLLKLKDFAILLRTNAMSRPIEQVY